MRVFAFVDRDNIVQYGVHALALKHPFAYSPRLIPLAEHFGKEWAMYGECDATKCVFAFEPPVDPVMVYGAEVTCTPLFVREQAPFRAVFCVAASKHGKQIGLHNAMTRTRHLT